jgi:rSAM/selenodomain-associated transferase 1
MATVTPSYRLLEAAHQGFAPRLVIMVKEPVAGRVKTRLARGIGMTAATTVYRVMLRSIAARLGRDPRWQTVLAVSPDAALTSSMLPRLRWRMVQGSGDLGVRLQNLFDNLPPGPVVVIGTDIPSITANDVAAAFRALGSHDAVFGPSHDGGYWLIGMRRRPHIVPAFARVRWSSAHALADTARNLAGLQVAHLRHHDDVDTADDLARLQRFIGRRVLPVERSTS